MPNHDYFVAETKMPDFRHCKKFQKNNEIKIYKKKKKSKNNRD